MHSYPSYSRNVIEFNNEKLYYTYSIYNLHRLHLIRLYFLSTSTKIFFYVEITKRNNCILD